MLPESTPLRFPFKSLLPALFAVAAFILGLYGAAYCKSISFSSTNASDNANSDPIRLYFGLWYYQWYTVTETQIQGTVILQTCNPYPEYVTKDSKWKTAMAFSTMALIIGGVITFWMCLACWVFPTKRHYKIAGVLYIICCFFQGMSLLFLGSDACLNNALVKELEATLNNVNSGNENDATAGDSQVGFQSTCSMAQGANCTIASIVFWFLAAIACNVVEPPTRAPIVQESHEVTYTKTTQADGTQVMTENVVKGEPVQ